MTDQEIFRKLAEIKDCGAAACLATIVEVSGSAPREMGAKMIVCVDGSTLWIRGRGMWRGQSPKRCLALYSHY